MENGLLRRVALGVFYFALGLSPLIGGYPSGAAYGQDMLLSTLRCLMLIAGLLLTLLPSPEAASNAVQGRAPRLTLGLMVAGVALTVLSCLVHSGFLTNSVLLFALVPGMLDWIVYGTVFYLALKLGPTHRLGILVSLAVGAMVAACYSLLEAHNLAGEAGHRAQGTFFSANFAAGLFALLLPVAVAYCLSAKERLGTLASGACAALMFGALVASGSRAGIALSLVGLIIALGLAVVAGRAKTLPWARIGGVLVALLVFGFFMRGAITSRVSAGGQEQSGDFRKWTWRGTVNMAKANPVLGTGPGTYPYRYPPYAQVEKTDLAHSSYLQTAAEQGTPALLALVAALAGVFVVALRALWSERRMPDTDTAVLLLCGLAGGLLAGMGRSVFDSEWSLLGNGIPFWCIAGLLLGLADNLRRPVAASASAPPAPRLKPAQAVGAIGMAVSLLLAFLCLRTIQSREAIQETMRVARQTGIRPALDTTLGWPPDPDIAANTGQSEVAAQLEPSGRRLYQLARQQFAAGDQTTGLATMQKAIAADPNNLQTRNRYALLLAEAGKPAESLNAYRDLLRIYEGPAGQVRAIPELTETYPAFAYFAVGQGADEANDAPSALADYDKAAKIIEAYSMTTPTYQQLEVAGASQTGVTLGERREELAQLYQRITDARLKRQPEKAQALQSQKIATMNLLRTLATELPGTHDAHAGPAH